jgi:predicted metal-dependent phosphoesterase TrpH
VARAAAAGIRTLAVTDHDTVKGLGEAAEAATARGLTFVNGIEITAVEDDRDVHVLGYFFDPADPGLLHFLDAQRADRVRRVREIAGRLSNLGAPVDPEPLIAEALAAGRSIGRPHVAAALVAARHVATRDEAFARFLGRSAPAFVPRRGASVAEIIAIIRQAAGLASLAHPGLTRLDEKIPHFVAAGLNALEARHGDHDQQTEARYRAIARSLGLAVSGGSDFHGDGGHHRGMLGSVTLPPGDFDALIASHPAGRRG